MKIVESTLYAGQAYRAKCYFLSSTTFSHDLDEPLIAPIDNDGNRRVSCPMNESQRLYSCAGHHSNDSVGGKPSSVGICKQFITWRIRRLLRLALRVAEEPILVLELSDTPGFFWPVLLEHRNRIIISSSPTDTPEAYQEPPLIFFGRIRRLPAPFDYAELRKDSVDCVLISLPSLHEWEDGDIETLETIQKITRDTVILFSGFPLDSGAGHGKHRANQKLHIGMNRLNDMKSRLQAIGFFSIGNYGLLPALNSPSVHILRKSHPQKKTSTSGGFKLMTLRSA